MRVSRPIYYISIGIILSLIVAAVLNSCSGAAADEPVTGRNFFLDTVCTVSVYEITSSETGEAVTASEAEESAKEAIDKAFERCAELDKTLSRTSETSDIYKINHSAGKWTEVNDDTVRLIEMGISFSELSEGEYDITVGGLTELWDFHAEPEDAKLPDSGAIAEAVKHIGWRNIVIKGNSIRLTDRETKLDLGGIAKGYIGDCMAEVLEEQGVTSGIINLGGNITCIGGRNSRPKNTENGEGDFVIGIEAPFSDRSELVGKVKVMNAAVVTSGVYERKIEVDGRLYHHILSTKTGYSAETDLDAVTVYTDKGKSADADALSTICLIKGAEEGKKLIESIDGAEAVFILHDGSIEKTSGSNFEEDEQKL